MRRRLARATRCCSRMSCATVFSLTRQPPSRDRGNPRRPVGARCAANSCLIAPRAARAAPPQRGVAVHPLGDRPVTRPVPAGRGVRDLVLDPLGCDDGHGYRLIASSTQRAALRLSTSHRIRSSAFSLGWRAPPLVRAQRPSPCRRRSWAPVPTSLIDPELAGHLRDRLTGLRTSRTAPCLKSSSNFACLCHRRPPHGDASTVEGEAHRGGPRRRVSGRLLDQLAAQNGLRCCLAVLPRAVLVQVGPTQLDDHHCKIGEGPVRAECATPHRTAPHQPGKVLVQSRNTLMPRLTELGRLGAGPSVHRGGWLAGRARPRFRSQRTTRGARWADVPRVPQVRAGMADTVLGGPQKVDPRGAPHHRSSAEIVHHRTTKRLGPIRSPHWWGSPSPAAPQVGAAADRGVASAVCGL